MITAQHVVNSVLQEAAKLGRADETMVLVTDRVQATLRWAGNSMTTNGVSVSRTVTVISIVRQGESAFVGTVVSAEVDPRVIPDLVAASQEAARSAPEAGDAAPLLADTAVPVDWDAPVAGTGPEVFADVAGSLSRDSPAPTGCTGLRTTVCRPHSWRRRPACAGATPSPRARSRSTPNAATPAPGRASARPISSTCQPIGCSSSCRPGWGGPRGGSSYPRAATRRSCRRRRWPT